MRIDPQNCNEVCGFMYCVDGPDVVRYGPGWSRSTVLSPVEIEESLTKYQKELLHQNRRAAFRPV